MMRHNVINYRSMIFVHMSQGGEGPLSEEEGQSDANANPDATRMVPG